MKGKLSIALLCITLFARAQFAHADTVIASYTSGTDDVAMYGMVATNFYVYAGSSTVAGKTPTTVVFPSVDNKSHDFNFSLSVAYLHATSEANCALSLGTHNYEFPGNDLLLDPASALPHTVTVPFTGISAATSSSNCIQVGTSNWGAFLGAGQTIKGTNPSAINFILYSGAFDYTTRIDSVVPDHIVVATGTPISLLADIVSNPDDWQSNWFVRYKYLRKSSSAAAIADTNTLFTVLDRAIPYAGPDVNEATTTFTLPGNYFYRVEIRRPSALSSISAFFGLSNLYDPGLLAHFDTQFTVDHQTAYDILVASTTNSLYNIDASTTVNFRESCGSLVNFDVLTCLGLLFIPTSSDLINDVNNLKTQLLFKAPWGYFSRFMAIISDTSTSTIPAISASVPISASESVLVQYDMGDIITGAGDILNSAKTPEGMDVQDIAEPWLRLFLALTVITIIIRDLLSMGNNRMPHGQ